MILKQIFFDRPTLVVARELLGKFLVRLGEQDSTDASLNPALLGRKKLIVAMITEVEAYDGFDDKASHASRGMTKRNKIMFGPPGFWYVYFTYGMHWMLNIVVGPKGYPAAILIRGVGGVVGPARLTKFFKIDGKFNNKISAPKTRLWIEDRGVIVKDNVVRTPRIGVAYAGPVWSKKKYRFILKDQH
jgi:DNA-3-methyladenine glycosylase